jgi:ClpP class serine protease
VAQGRVWTGEQALELKLVDSLGGLDDAIKIATQLASVQGDVSIVRFPERKGFVDQLLDELANPEPVAGLSFPALALSESTKELKAALSEAMTLEQLLTDGGPVVLLPGNISIR